jgi:hypothetical protein
MAGSRDHALLLETSKLYLRLWKRIVCYVVDGCSPVRLLNEEHDRQHDLTTTVVSGYTQDIYPDLTRLAR